MRTPSADELDDAARRIEHWLLHSGVQLDDGPHRGGVAGRLDGQGRPEYLYLEITGYYLTAMAWLAGGGSRSADSGAPALERGQRAMEWMRSATAGGRIPPTRLYLIQERDDWRNAAIFSFDVAMAARGAACFGATGDEDPELVGRLASRLADICGATAPLASHALRDGEPLPDRWSTRPGPHHLKVAAAILRLPSGGVDAALLRASHETVAHWAERLTPTWPCPELHPMLYGLEGLLTLPAPSAYHLDVVEQVCETILALQHADGSLPAEAGAGSSLVRSDVLAQALRAAILLGASRHRKPDARLDRLAEALLRHVRPDGGVLFSVDQDVANAWCAMLAHQALVLHLHAVRGDGPPAHAIATLI